MIHLHGFSHYSMQQGLANPKEIIEKAKQLGQDAIAITDYNSGYGLLEFYEKSEDIKPILGAHLLLSYDGEKFLTIVLLAKNYKGYKNLIKLISIANTKNYKKYPYLTISDLKEFGNNLIALSGTNGEIENNIISGESDNLIIDKISEYEEIFEGEFYLEFVTLKYSDFPQRKKIEKKFYDFIKNNNKKGVVTSFYKYIDKNDKSTYDVLLCIKNNRKFYDSNRPKLKGDYYIMTDENVKEILEINGIEKDFQNYLINKTHEISNKINVEIPLHQLLFPKYTVPEKYVELYKRLK